MDDVVVSWVPLLVVVFVALCDVDNSLADRLVPRLESEAAKAAADAVMARGWYGEGWRKLRELKIN
jgi:hypothetical protein